MGPTKNRLLLALALAGSVAAGGCSHVFRQPEVRLESVRLGGVGLRGATLVAQLHITNPNGFDLAARSFTYDLELQDEDNGGDWVRLAQGTIDQKLEVTENSAKVVEIPIEFRYSDLGPAVRSLIDRGTFGYRVSGSIQVQEPLSRTVPYKKTGRVTMSGVR